MSSRFTFNRHVRDIENNLNSTNSPHSNRSHTETPQSKHTTPTSVSPHNSTFSFKPPSQLKIRLPTQHQQQKHNHHNKSQTHSSTINHIHHKKTERRQRKEIHKEKEQHLVAQQFSFLTVPSDSENNLSLTSSPLISEPSPNPCASPLILNTLTNSKSTTSPEQADSIKFTSKPIGFHPNISIELDLNRKDSNEEEEEQQQQTTRTRTRTTK